MKKLFAESDVNEQICLMTVAPRECSRQKIERWFVLSSFYQSFFICSNICRYQSFIFIRFRVKRSYARRLLVLRKDKGMLAYPQCLRGNILVSDATIDTVFKFYREDGISRVSSNSKDTTKINGQAVAVRFMEMIVLDAYQIFSERFPGAVA